MRSRTQGGRAQSDIGETGAAGATGATGPGYRATSATSLAVGTGSKTATTQAGLAYTVGARVRLSSAGTPASWMEGIVTAYSTMTLVFTSDLIGTAGTHADWNINLAGEQGEAGGGGGTVTADAPLAGDGSSGSHLSIPAADDETDGYLAKEDWAAFAGEPAARDTAISTAVSAEATARDAAILAAPTFTPTADGKMPKSSYTVGDPAEIGAAVLAGWDVTSDGLLTRYVVGDPGTDPPANGNIIVTQMDVGGGMKAAVVIATFDQDTASHDALLAAVSTSKTLYLRDEDGRQFTMPVTGADVNVDGFGTPIAYRFYGADADLSGWASSVGKQVNVYVGSESAQVNNPNKVATSRPGEPWQLPEAAMPGIGSALAHPFFAKYACTNTNPPGPGQFYMDGNDPVFNNLDMDGYDRTEILYVFSGSVGGSLTAIRERALSVSFVRSFTDISASGDTVKLFVDTAASSGGTPANNEIYWILFLRTLPLSTAATPGLQAGDDGITDAGAGNVTITIKGVTVTVLGVIL